MKPGGIQSSIHRSENPNDKQTARIPPGVHLSDEPDKIFNKKNAITIAAGPALNARTRPLSYLSASRAPLGEPLVAAGNRRAAILGRHKRRPSAAKAAIRRVIQVVRHGSNLQ